MPVMVCDSIVLEKKKNKKKENEKQNSLFPSD